MTDGNPRLYLWGETSGSIVVTRDPVIDQCCRDLLAADRHAANYLQHLATVHNWTDPRREAAP